MGDVVKLKLNITVDALEVSDEYYAYLNKLRTEGIMVKIKGKNGGKKDGKEIYS